MNWETIQSIQSINQSKYPIIDNPDVEGRTFRCMISSSSSRTISSGHRRVSKSKEMFGHSLATNDYGIQTKNAGFSNALYYARCSKICRTLKDRFSNDSTGISFVLGFHSWLLPICLSISVTKTSSQGFLLETHKICFRLELTKSSKPKEKQKIRKE